VSYTYDHNSRLRTIAQDPLNPVILDYDAANRQLAFAASTMAFDDNGNLLTQTDPSGTIT
jgi:uncharacterized protein RhaS with RHS repeats